MDANYILRIDKDAVSKTFKKGSILQYKGQMTSQAFYVKKGLLRSYTIDSKGKEHIFMFAPEGWVIADIESQEFNRPAELYIDCLESSEVLRFDRSCLALSNFDAPMAMENAKLLYRRVGVLQRRVLMLMSAPALERYTYFMDSYPSLINRIPQRLIASYLGITPQALSTIRRKMAESKL